MILWNDEACIEIKSWHLPNADRAIGSDTWRSCICASVYENAHVEVRLAERWMDDGHVGGRRN